MKKEKFFNVLLFLLIFLVILSNILTQTLWSLDEIWNFNFARNVSNGLLPYRDFNMLQMPLLPLIAGIIIKLTINELIVMRILAAILCTGIFYIIYKVFYALNIKKELCICFTFLIAILFKDIFCYDYNYATLLVVLIIILHEIKIIKERNYSLYCDILIGFLAGLTVTLKQTTGILICFISLISRLLYVKNKEQLKTYLRCSAYRIIGMMIPILLLLIYLLYNNIFNDFINYTIKGATEFSNFSSYKNLIKFNATGLFAILVPISLIYFSYKLIIKEKNYKMYFLLIYGLALFIIVFPISDTVHFLIGSIPIIMLIYTEVYNACKIIFNKINKFKKIILCLSYFISSFIIIYMFIYSGNNFYKYYNNKNNFSILNHYHYITMDKTFEKQIVKIDEFILNSKKDVKIIDASAAIYMIPLDKYNKDYDMLLKGNIGSNGEEKIIKDILNNNRIYLVLNKKYKINWQTPLNIIEYVRKNKEKIGNVEIYDIYE